MILTEKQGGRLTLTLTADDQNGGTSSLSFDILVKPNSAPQVIASTNSLNIEQGFGTFTLDLSSIFFDEDGQMLTYDIAVIDSAVLAVDLIGHDLIITEQKSGATDIIIIANDGNEGVVTYILKVKVSGLLGLDLQHAINVYPNPAIKIISLILPDGTESVHVDIMDINGRKWQVESKVTVEGLELDVMDLPSGVYFMKLLIDEISVYKRIIKN